jgi:hypothetical protein
MKLYARSPFNFPWSHRGGSRGIDLPIFNLDATLGGGGAAAEKVGVFWNVTPCILVGMYRIFGGNLVRHSLALMMVAADFSEASIRSHQTSRCHIPEGSTSS